MPFKFCYIDIKIFLIEAFSSVVHFIPILFYFIFFFSLFFNFLMFFYTFYFLYNIRFMALPLLYIPTCNIFILILYNFSFVRFSSLYVVFAIRA